MDKDFILKLNKLPEEAKKELVAYVDFLLNKYKKYELQGVII